MPPAQVLLLALSGTAHFEIAFPASQSSLAWDGSCACIGSVSASSSRAESPLSAANSFGFTTRMWCNRRPNVMDSERLAIYLAGSYCGMPSDSLARTAEWIRSNYDKYDLKRLTR